MLNNKGVKGPNLHWVIPTIVAVLSIFVVVFFIFSIRGSHLLKDKKAKEGVIPVENMPDKEPKANYIDETNYKGNLHQFPELYEIPFGKTSAYRTNKEYTKTHYKIFAECEQKSTDFMEKLCNVDYREIGNNRIAFSADVLADVEYDAYYTKNYNKQDEKTIYLYERIDELLDYFIENQVQAEAKFYTDDSLVYYDFYTFVRGELVFTIYENNDLTCTYKPGVEYQIPVDVALEIDPDDPSRHVICAYGLSEDPYFFLN